MAKKIYEGKTFVVLISCRNKKAKFTPGDYVSLNDFGVKVIKNWLEIGVLEEVKNGGG